MLLLNTLTKVGKSEVLFLLRDVWNLLEEYFFHGV